MALRVVTQALGVVVFAVARLRATASVLLKVSGMNVQNKKIFSRRIVACNAQQQR